ncbi:MAG: BlaI/MecI/CopY family transcriptional regulator [Planctomycetota bacterium]
MNPKELEIPERELDVLSALWRLGEGSVREVREELESRDRSLAHNTVLTLLGRLETRGHVACDRSASANVYRPLVSREAVTKSRLGALVEQLADGKASSLILQLVESHELGPDDIGELRALLNRLESERSRGAKEGER